MPMYMFFITVFANLYGVNESIILTNICFWIDKNIKNNKHFHDGRFWTYNSITAFLKQYPFLKRGQINRALDHLVDLKVLYKGNYNKNAYDRTTWYSVSDDTLKIYHGKLMPDYGNEHIGFSFLENGNMNSPNTQNSEMDDMYKDNPVVNFQEPIPYLNTDINSIAAAANDEVTQIKKYLQTIDPELSYDDVFYKKLQSFLSDNELDLKYIDCVMNYCKSRKPDSIRAFFRKLIFEGDQITRYDAIQKDYQKRHPMIICPICDVEHKKHDENCPQCGFSKNDLENSIEVERAKIFYSWSDEMKIAYKNETDFIFSEVSQLITDPNSYKNKLAELDKKYGLPT